MNMKILVIDGQGGNLGKQLCKMLLERLPNAKIRAVGTNSLATESMLKTGISEAATGENAVIVGAKWADIIIVYLIKQSYRFTVFLVITRNEPI